MSLVARLGVSSSISWSGLLFSLGLWLAGLMQAAHADLPPRVAIVLSDSAPTYREVAKAFASALADKYPLKIMELNEFQGGGFDTLAEKTLIVPIGVRAMRETYGALGEVAPILSLLAPQAATHSFGDAGLRGSAVYIDQPPGRYLAFAKRLMPRAVKVGIIISSDFAGGIRGYAAEAKRLKLDLQVATVRDQQDIPHALQNILGEVDLLLLVPDSAVVNESTVRHILIASYRQRVPVIGFSRGLTNAGAVASLVSSPTGIGRQGGLLARQWSPVTGALPAARYASDFDLVFNRQVARSLDMEVPLGEPELERWRNSLE